MGTLQPTHLLEDGRSPTEEKPCSRNRDLRPRRRSIPPDLRGRPTRRIVHGDGGAPAPTVPSRLALAKAWGETLLLAGASLAVAGPAAAQSEDNQLPRRFKIVRLDTLGGPSGNALSLNSKGRITGAADNAGWLRHACLWTDTLEDLDPKHPASISEAWGINDYQDVVGFLDVSGVHKAMLWPREGGPVELFRGSPFDSYAYDVNDSKGIAATDGADAYFWSPPTGARKLATLGGYSRAWSINAAGDVAGSSVRRNPAAEVPVVWERDSENGLHAAPVRLVPGSVYGVAYGINDHGHVVGWSNDGSGANATAFLSRRVPGCRELSFLGVLPNGTYSVARAINDRNQVVGAADGAGAPWGHAFYWDERSGMLDLNDLILPVDQSDWELIQANDISDDGRIVGYGLHFPTGASQGFVLIPSPQPIGSGNQL